MKTKTSHIRQLAVAAALALASVSVSHAQFTSGSDGSYGPINITANTTLPMPDDGIFHCTTIDVASGRTLSFAPNARNTPVYLLATGDITINGIVSLNATGGTGGAGGFNGGARPISGISAAGDGFGPGGGIAGGNASFLGSPLLIPLVGGGGGGGAGNVGGGGGGAILLASSTKVTLSGSGLVRVNGQVAIGSGSGGAVRIVAPDVGGNGAIQAAANAAAGNGTVRIDSFALTNQTWSITGNRSYGANMILFPPNLPKLEIIEVAGAPVDPNAAGPVTVEVGEGSPEQQTVKVRATNFGGTAQVTVAVVPEDGPSARFDLDIPNPGPGSSEATVNVNVPANTISHLYVWTR